MRVIPRLIGFPIPVFSLPSLRSRVTWLCPLLLFSCTQPTDSTDKRTVERERIEVSGSITEDTVWEQRKDYLVVGDIVVGENTVLTLEPGVRIFFKANTEEDYYGLIVKGKLRADGSDRGSVLRCVMRENGTEIRFEFVGGGAS